MKKIKETEYRADLPAVPERLKYRPILRGYPVPWFVAELDDGTYDFRVADGRKVIAAIKRRLCWVCGRALGSAVCFTIGPMCAVNRINSEPPSHKECAIFSAIACPFLNQSERDYREGNYAEGLEDKLIGSAGYLIKRQPGAVCLWITKSYGLIQAPGGQEFLFKLGDPDAVLWYSHGREATRAEVLESIETGLPILREMAAAEGWAAVKALERLTEKAYKLIPPETIPPRKTIFASAARSK